MALRKAPGADLRRQYVLHAHLGTLLALLFTGGAFLWPTGPTPPPSFVASSGPLDILTPQDIPPTVHTTPPPPAAPPPPIAIEDTAMETDWDFSLEFRPLDAVAPPVAPPLPSAPSSSPPVDEPALEPFLVVEQMPVLLDARGVAHVEIVGDQQSVAPLAALADLQRQIRYPEMAQRAGIQGRVTLTFVVDPTGRVQDATVLRGIGGGCDEEALRVVQAARFRPGRQRGQAVPVRLSLPITFRLR